VFSDWKGRPTIFLGKSGGYGVVLGSYLAQFTIFWAFLPSEWEKNYDVFDRAKNVVLYNFTT